jgi:putative lipoic acid-binding regulatory protein
VDTLSENLDKELGLNYPCNWEYKLITDSSDDLKSSIKELLGNRNYKLVFSKKSKNGKYDSYILSLLVHSDKDRKNIYESLKKDKNIKIII